MVEEAERQEEQQDAELGERLVRGQEAQTLLQNPLMENFFAARFHANYKAFCDLPLGATLEQYQTVHHNFLSLQDLRRDLEKHITRAKTDRIAAESQEGVKEWVGV